MSRTLRTTSVEIRMAHATWDVPSSLDPGALMQFTKSHSIRALRSMAHNLGLDTHLSKNNLALTVFTRTNIFLASEIGNYTRATLLHFLKQLKVKQLTTAEEAAITNDQSRQLLLAAADGGHDMDMGQQLQRIVTLYELLLNSEDQFCSQHFKEIVRKEAPAQKVSMFDYLHDQLTHLLRLYEDWLSRRSHIEMSRRESYQEFSTEMDRFEKMVREYAAVVTEYCPGTSNVCHADHLPSELDEWWKSNPKRRLIMCNLMVRGKLVDFRKGDRVMGGRYKVVKVISKVAADSSLVRWVGLTKSSSLVPWSFNPFLGGGKPDDEKGKDKSTQPSDPWYKIVQTAVYTQRTSILMAIAMGIMETIRRKIGQPEPSGTLERIPSKELVPTKSSWWNTILFPQPVYQLNTPARERVPVDVITGRGRAKIPAPPITKRGMVPEPKANTTSQRTLVSQLAERQRQPTKDSDVVAYLGFAPAQAGPLVPVPTGPIIAGRPAPTIITELEKRYPTTTPNLSTLAALDVAVRENDHLERLGLKPFPNLKMTKVPGVSPFLQYFYANDLFQDKQARQMREFLASVLSEPAGTAKPEDLTMSLQNLVERYMNLRIASPEASVPGVTAEFFSRIRSVSELGPLVRMHLLSTVASRLAVSYFPDRKRFALIYVPQMPQGMPYAYVKPNEVLADDRTGSDLLIPSNQTSDAIPSASATAETLVEIGIDGTARSSDVGEITTSLSRMWQTMRMTREQVEEAVMSTYSTFASWISSQDAIPDTNDMRELVGKWTMTSGRILGIPRERMHELMAAATAKAGWVEQTLYQVYIHPIDPITTILFDMPFHLYPSVKPLVYSDSVVRDNIHLFDAFIAWTRRGHSPNQLASAIRNRLALTQTTWLRDYDQALRNGTTPIQALRQSIPDDGVANTTLSPYRKEVVVGKSTLQRLIEEVGLEQPTMENFTAEVAKGVVWLRSALRFYRQDANSSLLLQLFRVAFAMNRLDLADPAASVYEGDVTVPLSQSLLLVSILKRFDERPVGDLPKTALDDLSSALKPNVDETTVGTTQPSHFADIVYGSVNNNLWFVWPHLRSGYFPLQEQTLEVQRLLSTIPRDQLQAWSKEISTTMAKLVSDLGFKHHALAWKGGLNPKYDAETRRSLVMKMTAELQQALADPSTTWSATWTAAWDAMIQMASTIAGTTATEDVIDVPVSASPAAAKPTSAKPTTPSTEPTNLVLLPQRTAIG